MDSSVEVAVIPAAGFGTRLLPISKVVSKELFPLSNKPAIHYIVLECIAAGIKEIVLVLSRRKMDIFRYFEPDAELESFLENRKKLHLIYELREFKKVKIDYVIQEEQLGLGHAIMCAEEKVQNRNFAVLLPDDIYIIKEDKKKSIGVIKKLIELFEVKRPSGGLILVRRVPKDKVSRYGVVVPISKDKNVIRFRGVVEKPNPQDAPSCYAIVGRYVFTPNIFDWLKTESYDSSGEIQLANALGRLSYQDSEAILACEIRGTWLDIGSVDGYLRALKKITDLERSSR